MVSATAHGPHGCFATASTGRATRKGDPVRRNRISSYCLVIGHHIAASDNRLQKSIAAVTHRRGNAKRGHGSSLPAIPRAPADVLQRTSHRNGTMGQAGCENLRGFGQPDSSDPSFSSHLPLSACRLGRALQRSELWSYPDLRRDKHPQGIAFVLIPTAWKPWHQECTCLVSRSGR